MDDEVTLLGLAWRLLVAYGVYYVVSDHNFSWGNLAGDIAAEAIYW